MIVMPPGSSFIVGLTDAPMSIKVGNILEKLPHVTAVAPVITQVSTSGALEVIAGIDLRSYESLSGPFHYLSGGSFQGPDDALVDDLFAKGKHVKVGDTIEILNHNFRIAGVVAQGKGARKFLPIATLQDLVGAKDKASIFYLKLDDPANADAVVNEIKAVSGMEKYSPLHGVLSLHDDAQQLSRPVELHQRGDWDIRNHRVHRDFPGHVHRGHGADT